MKRLLLLAFVVLITGRVEAQDTRRFSFTADSSLTKRIDGREVTELFGFDGTDDEVQLRADRTLDYGDGSYDFFQNVKIIEDGDTLTAEQVAYDRHTRLGTAVGHVRLGDGEVVVTAPEGDFDLDANRADFREGVMMVDSVSVLTSDRGTYWTDENRAEFWGRVRLDSDDTDVLADSLTYHRDGKRSLAWGNVVVIRSDGESETYILSERAVNDDSLNTGRADGNVLVAQIRSDSSLVRPDTLLILAERVFSERSDLGDRMSAAGSVLVWKDDFSAIADSLVRVDDQAANRSETRMYDDPVIWVGESQVTGDTIRVTGIGSGIDSLLVSGRAFVAQEDSVLGKLQQLRGRGLVGLFESDSLRTLEMSPNAEAVFFNRTDEDDLGGALQVSSDRIIFFLEGDQIDTLKVYRDITGTYFPVGHISESLGLSGLEWRAEERPRPDTLMLRFRHAICRVRECSLTESN